MFSPGCSAVAVAARAVVNPALQTVAAVLHLRVSHVCGRLLRRFEHLANQRSHRWFRVFNESAVLMFIAIVVLVVVKPF